MPTMFLTATTIILLVGGRALAQDCPDVHVFGARETTVSPGFGSAGTVVDAVLSAYPGATSEAIDYPACGGQSSCGGIEYGDSVVAGIEAVAEAVNSFNTECPDTSIVLVGYSQGGQIIDDALCGGGDTNAGFTDTAVQLSESAVAQVKAAIFMGNPRWIAGLPYDIGTCESGGFAARESGFSCPSGDVVQSYCDAPDPYCCDGDDENTHQGYGSVYGEDALTFIQSQLG